MGLRKATRDGIFDGLLFAITFCTCLTATSCAHRKSVAATQVPSPVVIESSTMPADLAISHWLISRPFQFHPSDINAKTPTWPSGGLHYDFLSKVGCPESYVARNATFIMHHCIDSFKAFSIVSDVVQFDRIYPSLRYSVVYATATLYSPSDTSVGLSLGSSDGAMLWLNGQVLFDTGNTVERAAFADDDLIPLNLHAGTNTLLVKVDHKIADWTLFARLLRPDTFHRIQLAQLDHHLLHQRLLGARQLLRIEIPRDLSQPPANVKLVRWPIKQIYNLHAVTSGVYTLPHKPGYYDLTINIHGTELHDALYLGPPGPICARLATLWHRLRRTSAPYYQDDALLRRYQALISPQHREPSDEGWQKKILMVMRDAVVAVAHPFSANWSLTPGAHLREFQSSLDGASQDYLLYIPQAPRYPLPVVFVLPYAEAPNRQFLESSLIAWPDDLVAMEHAADVNHVAVAVINGRGTVGYAPIGEADFFEVLHDINRALRIDPNRLYLYGTCEGGWRALLLAEHHPSLFAAVGTYGPLLRPFRGRYFDTNWEGYNNIVALARNLSTLKVIVVKGGLDPRSPLPATREFVGHLRKEGVDTTLDIIPDGMHKERDLESRIFPMLARCRRVDVPRALHFISPDPQQFEDFWLEATPLSVGSFSVDATYAENRINVRSLNAASIQLIPSLSKNHSTRCKEVIWNGANKGTWCTKEARRFTTQPAEALSTAMTPQIVSAIFAKPFRLVVGTADDSGSLEASSFLRAWQKDFFTACQTVKDTAVSKRDLSHFNVVLFGVPKKGAAIAGVIDQLSVSHSGGGLFLQQHHFDSSHIEYVAAFTSPLDRSHQILIIRAMADSATDRDFALRGMYSAAVWNDKGQRLDAW